MYISYKLSTTPGVIKIRINSVSHFINVFTITGRISSRTFSIVVAIYTKLSMIVFKLLSFGENYLSLT